MCSRLGVHAKGPWFGLQRPPRTAHAWKRYGATVDSAPARLPEASGSPSLQPSLSGLKCRCHVPAWIFLHIGAAVSAFGVRSAKTEIVVL